MPYAWPPLTVDIWRGAGHADQWDHLSAFWSDVSCATVTSTVITIESTTSAGTGFLRLHYDAANSAITQTYSTT